MTVAGAALALLGALLLAAEVFVPAVGLLAVAGVVTLALGITLMIGGVSGLALSWALIAAVAVTAGGLAIVAVRLGFRSHRRKVATGQEQLVGAEATVLSWSGGRGLVQVRGETWQATGPEALRPGDRAEIVALDGLTLRLSAAGAA